MMNSQLKIIFAGTPHFAAYCLEKMLETHHTIVAIITPPDRKAGRGKKLKDSPVKKVAVKNRIRLLQPKTLKSKPIQEQIHELHADVLIDVACGLFIPATVLNTPRLGCFNVHPSLLPRWRGASPIQQAILAGDSKTGITIMKMDKGLDTGPIALQETCPIGPEETTLELEKRLMVIAADLLKQLLKKLTADELSLQKQDESQACYAPKIQKSDAKIDWNKTADRLHREIRAFNPAPVSFTTIGPEIIRIWRAKSLDQPSHQLPPGQIIQLSSTGIDVATHQGILRIQQLQFAGGKPLSVADALNSKRAFFERHEKFE
jgi:methionyl-tRNA formyltransferase